MVSSVEFPGHADYVVGARTAVPEHCRLEQIDLTPNNAVQCPTSRASLCLPHQRPAARPERPRAARPDRAADPPPSGEQLMAQVLPLRAEVRRRAELFAAVRSRRADESERPKAELLPAPRREPGKKTTGGLPGGLSFQAKRAMRQTMTRCRFGSCASISPSARSGVPDAGNCSTVAFWPSHSRVSRTTWPLGNSIASWCS